MAAIIGDISTDNKPNKWARGVCESLGLDPNRVKSLSIDFDRNDLVIVTVEMFLQDNDDFPAMPDEYEFVRTNEA